MAFTFALSVKVLADVIRSSWSYVNSGSSERLCDNVFVSDSDFQLEIEVIRCGGSTGLACRCIVGEFLYIRGGLFRGGVGPEELLLRGRLLLGSSTESLQWPCDFRKDALVRT